MVSKLSFVLKKITYFCPMSILVKNITKKYGAQKALDGVSFSLNKGEIVGFLGPNGAGKSTLLKILSAFDTDFEGEAFIQDIPVKENPLEVKKNIGYLPENNPLYVEMYVREYLGFHAGIHKIAKPRVEEIIKELALTSHAHKKIKALSKGYKQRVGLAAALLHDPPVLLLDEPTTGLDPNQLLEIRKLIKSIGKDKTLLFSTHILQEVQAVCDRILVIHQGELKADLSVDALSAQQDQVIFVEFDRKVKENFFEELAQLKSTQRMEETKWKLFFDKEKDMRSAIFDLAQTNQVKILSLTQETQQLEELFTSLTKD